MVTAEVVKDERIANQVCKESRAENQLSGEFDCACSSVLDSKSMPCELFDGRLPTVERPRA
jgi:hypothetical protein